MSKQLKEAIELAQAVGRQKGYNTPESLVTVSRGLAIMTQREADLRNLLASGMMLIELLTEACDSDPELVDQAADWVEQCSDLPKPVGDQ